MGKILPTNLNIQEMMKEESQRLLNLKISAVGHGNSLKVTP